MKRTAYVLYDPKTGRVLGSHHSVDADGKHVSQPVKQVRDQLRRTLELEPAQRADVLEAELPPGRFSHEFYVDVKAKKLVEKHDLQLKPQKDTLEGDGEDTTRIDVTVVDARGRTARSFDGEITVVTSRGRLSERGGRLTLQGGKGRIELQSAPETVHKVVVSALDPAGRCNLGTVELEFV